MTSGKDILVLFEKSCECLADQQIGEGANPSCLIWSGVFKKYLFKSFNELHYCPLFFYVHCL